MNKKLLIGIIVILVLTVIGIYFLYSRPEKEEKVYRVGILGPTGFTEIADGFKSGMEDLGYLEGENIIYDMKMREIIDQMVAGEISKKFVEDKVDLIFVFPTLTTIVARDTTKGTGIPVVFANAGIEEADLVESVHRPGGNITGVRHPGPDEASKRLEILLEIAPEVKRVWIGYNKNYATAEPTLEMLRPLAESKGITLVEVPATIIEDFEVDLAARAKLAETGADIGIDAIILMPDDFNHRPDGFAIISKFVRDYKVVLGGSVPYTVEGGAVFGNASNFFKMGELAAPLADKVLKGTPAGTIMVVTPAQDIWINYKVAQELGLTVPEGLLSEATEIIR